MGQDATFATFHTRITTAGIICTEQSRSHARTKRPCCMWCVGQIQDCFPMRCLFNGRPPRALVPLSEGCAGEVYSAPGLWKEFRGGITCKGKNHLIMQSIFVERMSCLSWAFQRKCSIFHSSQLNIYVKSQVAHKITGHHTQVARVRDKVAHNCGLLASLVGDASASLERSNHEQQPTSA